MELTFALLFFSPISSQADSVSSGDEGQGRPSICVCVTSYQENFQLRRPVWRFAFLVVLAKKKKEWTCSE